MKENDMELVAGLIDRAIVNRENAAELDKVRQDVEDLTKKFPIYSGL
jgi:glycine/serine hydroxymethyltransferase